MKEEFKRATVIGSDIVNTIDILSALNTFWTPRSTLVFVGFGLDRSYTIQEINQIINN